MDRLQFQELDFLTVTQHAVARCLQRNGTLELADIRSELECAAGIAPFMLKLAAEHVWKQAYVPTELGIVAGEVVNGVMTLRTYFRPGENGRPSRWDAARDLLPPLPPQDWSCSTAAMDRHSEALLDWYELHRFAVQERLSFLCEPYQRARDRLDQVWHDDSTGI